MPAPGPRPPRGPRPFWVFLISQAGPGVAGSGASCSPHPAPLPSAGPRGGATPRYFFRSIHAKLKVRAPGPASPGGRRPAGASFLFLPGPAPDQHWPGAPGGDARASLRRRTSQRRSDTPRQRHLSGYREGSAPDPAPKAGGGLFGFLFSTIKKCYRKKTRFRRPGGDGWRTAGGGRDGERRGEAIGAAFRGGGAV